MADFLKKLKNALLGKKGTEEVVNSVEDFNTLTKSYNSLLQQQIDQKKDRIKHIRTYINKYNKEMTPSSTINIQLVDMADTRIKEKGKGTIKKKMEWEKEFKNMNQKKGFII